MPSKPGEGTAVVVVFVQELHGTVALGLTCVCLDSKLGHWCASNH